MSFSRLKELNTYLMTFPSLVSDVSFSLFFLFFFLPVTVRIIYVTLQYSGQFDCLQHPSLQFHILLTLVLCLSHIDRIGETSLSLFTFISMVCEIVKENIQQICEFMFLSTRSYNKNRKQYYLFYRLLTLCIFIPFRSILYDMSTLYNMLSIFFT